MATTSSHSLNDLGTPGTSVPASDENTLQNIDGNKDDHEDRIEAICSEEAIERPTAKQNELQPPPSTKRWTWELVSDEDGRPSKKRRQTSPNLDPEALAGKGIRTRRMAKKDKAVTETIPMQPIARLSKDLKRRTVSASGDNTDEDVVPNNIKVARQRRHRRDQHRMPGLTRLTVKPKVKIPPITKEKRSRVIKLKIRMPRVSEQGKLPQMAKVKARAARLSRQSQSQRQVQIVQDPSQVGEAMSNDWQDDEGLESERAISFGQAGLGHASGNFDSLCENFRNVSSLDSIWPNYKDYDVNHIVEVMRTVRGATETDHQDIFPSPKKGPVRPLSLSDIIPPRTEITEAMRRRMAQRDEILQRKIQHEAHRNNVLAKDRERNKRKLEQRNTVLTSDEWTSITTAQEFPSTAPTQSAGEQDDDDQGINNFCDDMIDTVNAISEESKDAVIDEAEPSFAIEMSGAILAPDGTRLEEEAQQATSHGEQLKSQHLSQEHMAQSPDGIRNVEDHNNPEALTRPLTVPPIQSDDLLRTTRMHAIEISSHDPISSEDEAEENGYRKELITYDSSSDGQIERDPTRHSFDAYDRYMAEHDIEGDDEDDEEDEIGDSAWEQEGDFAPPDEYDPDTFHVYPRRYPNVPVAENKQFVLLK